MKRLLSILLLALWLPLPALALELETPVSDSLSIIETLKVLRDNTVKDNEFWAVINRLNLVVAKGPFMAGLRYDTEAYFLSEEYYVRYIPEKFFFQYEEAPFLARLGDSYARFGQGLTLSLLKRDEFGEDTTVQGALLQLSHENVEFEALVGPVNLGDDSAFVPQRAQTEEPEFIDERDLIWGTHLEAGAPQYVMVGGNWVGATLRFDPESQFADYEEDDRVNLYSVTARAPVMGGVGSLEGEYSWLEYDDQREAKLDDLQWEGRGGHLAATWNIGPVTLLTEATDYFRFEFPYHDPPSMENTDMSFGHMPNFADAIGARGRVDYTIPGIDLGLFANYTNIQTHEEMPAELADHYSDRLSWLEWIEHSYGGLDKTFGNGAYVSGSGGYREIPEGRYVHGDAKISTPIVRPHSLTAEYKIKLFHGFDLLQGTEYADHESDLTYGYAPYFSLTGTYEWSDEPSGGIITLGAEEEDNPHFWAVETTVQPADWARLTLGYGRYKGGLKCAGGVCRQMPPFEGLRSEFALRF